MEHRRLPVEGWRQVVHFTDVEAGLNAIIAVHDATLGPGCGGCRVFPYATFDAALEDVKNLSRGMTYKNAVGGIPFGGGKAVIIADPRTQKTPEMIKAFARAVDSLEGLYYTAEDSGVTERDIEIMQGVTRYAAGHKQENRGGNPSPFTARGVWRGMQATAKRRFGADSLRGMKVCIVGVGAVGMALAELIHEEGGALVVADVNDDAVREAKERFGAEAVSPEAAAGADCDIYSPCALGGAINETTIAALRAKAVCGGANNQLATPAMDAALRDRRILYAPDYVVNAAGVISVGLEILGEWTEDALTTRIDRIGETTTEIFRRAEAAGSPTGEIADKMATEIIARGRRAA